MDFSIRRINALLKKEIKDFAKNMNVSVMYLLPIMFSIIYSKLLGNNSSNDVMNKINILILCVGMNISLISSMVISMLIAEEKEKNTLRTLILSAVSPWEFLAGKVLITFLVSEVINIAIFFSIGCDIQYLGKYILITTLVLFSMIEIGAIIGIISPNQMATGVFSMPVVMIFFVIPMFAEVNKIIETIAKFLPSYHMNIMIARLFKGETFGIESTRSIAIILVWIIIAVIAFAFTYNKRGLDK
ncbi:ABC transporter permease [Clostridium botulinum]|uniref:ABC transporter permease n=1 Tax=Clostridium botulinum TaxID=1491 RepID=A0A6B4TIZ3_CLOBO|nr:ABC transporter permease [Clostridium botulinum]KRU26656.1 ABC-2 type transporter family protein [Clostridium sporogenes]KRU29517.1 ABC-2 type transporter family protein [Clostridium sporogenes]KRU35284.1 ABC-2 type transporter family protein [Clostridium sporogenes]KRU49511.1 ABC-2 type transporter family protein [Clostridium sporogenes]MBZ1328589.1 ABC transporter permease [Clostridium botulinum]